MKNLKFKKGDFITQTTSRSGSFAVFEGEVYESSKGKGEPLEYSLMCFYNPDHFLQDDMGNYKREYVFECDVDDETCEYFIDETDFQYWRGCTEEEKRNALKYLAEVKKIAFEEDTKTFRKLKDTEKISFDAPKSTGNCGGNVQHRGSESNPFYGRGGYNGGYRQEHETETKKYITRNVKDDWEQKEPITNMSDEHKEMLDKLCVTLERAFSYSTGTMRYPTNGSQVPIRYGSEAYCGWPAMMGIGGYCGWDAYD